MKVNKKVIENMRKNVKNHLKIDKERLIRRIKNEYTLFFLAIIIVFLLFFFFYPQFKSFSTNLIKNYGFFGLFVIVIILDTIIQPISPDIIVFSSTFGGANIFHIGIVAGIASTVAAMISYLIGRVVGKDGFKRWFGEKHLEKGERLFEKYGIWAVVVGALTPVPYSVVCWCAGIYKMNFYHLILTAILTRTIRFVLIGLVGFAL